MHFKRKQVFIISLIFLGLTVGSVLAENRADVYLDGAYISTALENYPIESAVPILLNRGISPAVIIIKAQKAGFNDRRITTGLYRSNLPASQVIMEVMQSPMSPGSVLQSLADEGVDPVIVLHLLVQGGADTEDILDVCEYMLARGYTQIAILSVLVDSGADRNTVFMAMEAFNIPIATVILVYGDILGDIEQFGHIYTRHSLPKPALIQLGMARIYISLISTSIYISPIPKGRIISPKQPSTRNQ